MAQIEIDFVVTWLDSTDPNWQKEYNKYSTISKGDKDSSRFRNMDIFHYWFRGIEMYAPWVHKVFLITNGKFPDWINSNHPKLVLVKHEDYIPKEYLPTFNSCTIELFMHRIKGLSEYFVYFNDDVFLNSPTTPEYYFKNKLPCDTNKETCFNVPIYTSKDRFGINMSMLANIGIINSQFRRWDTVRNSPKRWFGFHLGFRGLIMSCLLAKQRLFIGFSNSHNELAYLKSTFNEVWEKQPEFMQKSCTRFREDVIANPYLFRYWQLAKNYFYPQKRKSRYFFLTDIGVIESIKKTLNNKNIISLCLNDSALCYEKDYLLLNEYLKKLLDKKYPQKSQYEK